MSSSPSSSREARRPDASEGHAKANGRPGVAGGDPAARRRSRPRWHLLYYLLVTLDLATVVLSLGLNHQLSGLYSEAVRVNERWGVRLEQYSDLGRLAADVNAPGNDVFDSADAGTESRRMKAALRQFDARLEALKRELGEREERATTVRLSRNFHAVAVKMGQMSGEANRIFSYFEQGEAGLAGRRMATMDRKYNQLLESLAKLRKDVSSIQRRHFNEQREIAKSIAKFEYLIAALVLMMITGATFYGHKMGRRVTKAAEAERAAEALAVEQRTLRHSEERLRALVANAHDVIAVVDPVARIRYATPAAEHQWGIAPEELHGTEIAGRIHPEDHDALQRLLTMAGGAEAGDARAELRLRHARGAWRDYEVVASELHGIGEDGRLVLTFHDITERKAFERDLVDLAFQDSLTGLPNRAAFRQRLDAVMSASAHSKLPAAVLFLDLDDFKLVNDTLGHRAGDEVIQIVGQRLHTAVRPGDMVARIGGDEFTVLLGDVRDESDAQAVAQRIIASLGAPVSVDGRSLFLRGSVGIAVSQPGADTPDDLLRHADLAMYRAKARGGGWDTFEAGMSDEAIGRLNLESDLRRALEAEEFHLAYQPIVAAADGRIEGFEALLRWTHPTRGLVSPAEFIPLAEASGLIVPIGRWVLAEACRQAVEWGRHHVSAASLTMSVNVSARQLREPTFNDDVLGVLRDSGLAPRQLQIEITESAVVEDPDATSRSLGHLAQAGVRLAVDDFGTGYSSLGQLRALPFDELKIDRSFVNDLDSDEGCAAIIKGVIEMAAGLGITVTAEGVETGSQAQQIAQLNCRRAQGYHFFRPMSAEHAGALLERHTPARLAA